MHPLGATAGKIGGATGHQLANAHFGNPIRIHRRRHIDYDQCRLGLSTAQCLAHVCYRGIDVQPPSILADLQNSDTAGGWVKT